MSLPSASRPGRLAGIFRRQRPKSGRNFAASTVTKVDRQAPSRALAHRLSANDLLLTATCAQHSRRISHATCAPARSCCPASREREGGERGRDWVEGPGHHRSGVRFFPRYLHAVAIPARSPATLPARPVSGPGQSLSAGLIRRPPLVRVRNPLPAVRGSRSDERRANDGPVDHANLSNVSPDVSFRRPPPPTL